MNVTFGLVGGKWAVFRNGTLLLSQQSPSSYAYFSNPILNPSARNYRLVNGDIHSWEDGGDNSFNDVIFRIPVANAYDVTGGDILNLGPVPANLGYVVGEDGVDTVNFFRCNAP